MSTSQGAPRTASKPAADGGEAWTDCPSQPQKEPALPTSWPQTSDLQDCGGAQWSKPPSVGGHCCSSPGVLTHLVLLMHRPTGNRKQVRSRLTRKCSRPWGSLEMTGFWSTLRKALNSKGGWSLFRLNLFGVTHLEGSG